MKRVVASYVADAALQRIATSLEKASVEAAERLLLLLSSKLRPTPARMRFRRREISQLDVVPEGGEEKASPMRKGKGRVLFGREAVYAKELRRLLRTSRVARGRVAAEAGAKAMAILLPPKFNSNLQSAYRGLLFLSEMLFSRWALTSAFDEQNDTHSALATITFKPLTLGASAQR